jgi:hypothetical protein
MIGQYTLATPLPSKDRRDTQMGGIYEVHHWDELRTHDIHTKFHKDWFTHSEVNVGGHIDCMEIA